MTVALTQVSSASVERVFSQLVRIKKECGETMLEETVFLRLLCRLHSDEDAPDPLTPEYSNVQYSLYIISCTDMYLYSINVYTKVPRMGKCVPECVLGEKKCFLCCGHVACWRGHH